MPPRRSLVGTLLRRLLSAIGWLLLSVVALAVSAWLHVFTPVARELLRDVVLEQVNPTIRGRIAIGSIDEVGLGTIGVTDLAIFDPDGRRVLAVEHASVEPDLATLLEGSIALDRVTVRDGELRLVETADGSPSIATAFAPVEPAPETTEPGPDVRIHAIHLDGMRITGTYGPVTDTAVEGLEVEAGLAIVDGVPSAEVRSARFDLARDGRVVAELGSLAATYDAAEGAADARVSLAIGDGTVDVDARASLPDPADEGAQPDIVATVEVAGLGPDDVDGLGLVDTGPWVGQVDARIHFDGTPRTFTTEADVTTPAGDVHAEARMQDGDRVEATVRTDGFEPARILAGVAAPPVRGKVSATASGLAGDSGLDVEARVTDLTAGPWRVPSLSAAAHVADDHVRVDGLRLPYLEGDVDVRGTVGFDGAIDLQVAAHVPQLSREPNLRRLMPELTGGLDADLEVEVEPSVGEVAPRIAARGEAELRDARVGPARMGRLRVRGTVRGRPDAPVVDATVRGEGLALPEQGLRLRSVDLDATGGPSAYELEGRGAGPGGERGRLRARVERRGETWIASASGSARGLLGRDWSVEADEVEVAPDGAVRVGSAEVRTGETRAHVRGVYRPSGGSDLEATVERIDVGVVAELLGLEQLAGEVNGRASFAGSPERPELDVSAIYSGTLKGVRVDDLALTAKLSSQDGRLSADLSVDLGPRGAVEASAEGTFELARRRTLAEALEDGHYDIRVGMREVSLALVGDVVPEAPALHGTVAGEVELGGHLDSPALALSLRARELGIDERSDLGAQLAGSYADGEVRTRLVARDGRGAIAQAELSASLDAPALLREPPADPVRFARSTPWKVSVVTNARRLDELPGPARVDLPAKVAGTLHVSNEPDLPPVVDVDLGVTWLGVEHACAAFETPRARARMRLYEGEARVEMIGRLGTEQVLGAEATARAPVTAWMEHGLPDRLPEVDAHAEIAGLALSKIPHACEVATGTLEGTIDAEDLLTDAPDISVALDGRGLRFRDTPARDLALRLGVDRERAEALVELTGPEGPSLDAEARVPLAWRDGVPSLSQDAPIDAHVAMDGFRLEPLGAVPALAFAEGALNGRIDVSGRVSDPDIGGRIELDDVGFGLVSPAQRFHDGSGAIVLHPTWIGLDSVELHDLDGTLRASGSIGLDGLRPVAANVALFADDLPIRQEGSPVGKLDATASVRAEIAEEEVEIWIETDDVAMEVAQNLRTGTQSLEDHPDIVVVRDGEVIGEAAEGEEAEPMQTDFIVHVDATDPFWVRRSDFAMQLQARLDIRMVGRGLQVGGRVNVRRGFLELLGKRFDLVEGRISFLGGQELNPRVEMKVAHDLAGGDKVFVRITGHMQRPDLEFSSTVPGVNTAGDALALIAGGRGAQGGSAETASAQAASALAGVTAGILTLTARRELGELMPDISIEATDSGARLRAGFDAERLVPEFLSGVVQGAYVEGFVGTEGNGEEGQREGSSANAGFLIELMLPRNLVLTTQVKPPTAASADVMWEP